MCDELHLEQTQHKYEPRVLFIITFKSPDICCGTSLTLCSYFGIRVWICEREREGEGNNGMVKCQKEDLQSEMTDEYLAAASFTWDSSGLCFSLVFGCGV